ncbi:DUF3040 domain-containing protein [Amycolatopsis sp. FDAARGOS 1241]|uniref:DUF3040 domain-containing protein n=1 Tax=Amycolatopsis sp. FDAARGOS 1241 TaxID=2778070 RepID=UPI0019505C20|nr:DUF3040 domain-containing protein [Amycolatopsis sp. FDAARGOS 1241]QRP42931.1 DUF3040 domain-containing protein [Amycolatopsis sp. FDAARGOS 1241]
MAHIVGIDDYEKKTLNDIERQLTRESPRLEQSFAEFRPIPSAVASTGPSVLTLLATGLLAMVAGVELSSPVMIITGTLMTTVVPAVLEWILDRRRQPPHR